MIDDQYAALPDRIADTFAGKSVFLTGGTGFIGKVLVEKLLRRCPDIRRIIMLVRPKKGKNPKQRLDEIINGPLYEKVREIYDTDEIRSKVTIIEGDITAEDLNLSQESRDILCSEVDIFVHAAASVRFDASLKDSIFLNTRGTKYVLGLAKELKKLELFVYLSTAYCHPEEAVLEEKSYQPRYDPHQMIHAMETADDDTVSALTPAILSDLPNSYTLSKALAEALVEEASSELPLIILRPSVVIPILEEPLPGWSDNLNGPSGLLIAAGKGVMRSMYGDDSNYVDFMPVDIFASAVMVAIWNYFKNGDHRRYINVTSSSEMVVPWSYILDLGKNVAIDRVPFNNVLWVPGGSMTKSKVLHKSREIFYHWVPALLIDLLLICLGYKPILVRVQNRLSKGVQVLQYYLEHQWTFKSDSVQQIRKKMNKRERALYKIDDKGLDIDNYVVNCIKCSRLYILNESEESLPAARRHMARLKFAQFVLTVVFWCLLVYFLGIFQTMFIFMLYALFDRFVQ